ncbi:MAG TPA: MlaD family protein, partial [Candidatus Baltobacteraceae bacterium]|nr:MlaD family protein [Candidatus Baltobacteraceae bacterium]
MKNSLETKLGVFVALTVIVAVIIIETLGDVHVFQRGYNVSALFDTAQDLKVGDPVKMAGIEIGQVENIQPDYADSKVKITMKLHSDAIVKTDSKATIKFTGLMGQYFVS